MRIAIAGVPRAGKTTLAEQFASELGYPVLHSDDLINMGWSEASAELARRMQSPGPWIVEGVAVSRALRKALDLTSGRPCDQLYFLSDPRVALTQGQEAMAAGCRTVHQEIAPELRRRGVQLLGAVERRAASSTPNKQSVTAPAKTNEPYQPPHEAGSRWGRSPGRGFG